LIVNHNEIKKIDAFFNQRKHVKAIEILKNFIYDNIANMIGMKNRRLLITQNFGFAKIDMLVFSRYLMKNTSFKLCLIHSLEA
jgi:hypothetical protein